MTIEETRQIIIQYFTNKQNYYSHKKGCQLRINDNNYRIMPDDAYYYDDKVLLFEYEATKRPVESISKYYWLLTKKDLSKENIKIKLFITINNNNANQIRIETIEILGNLLNKNYPNSFEFYFLTFSELTEENLLNQLNIMTSLS